MQKEDANKPPAFSPLPSTEPSDSLSNPVLKQSAVSFDAWEKPKSSPAKGEEEKSNVEDFADSFDDSGPTSPFGFTVSSSGKDEEDGCDDGTTNVEDADQQLLASIDDFDDYEQTIVDSKFLSEQESAKTGQKGGNAPKPSTATSESPTTPPPLPKLGELEPSAGYCEEERTEIFADDAVAMLPPTQAVELSDPLNDRPRSRNRGLIIVGVLSSLAAVIFVSFTLWLYWSVQEDKVNENKPSKHRKKAKGEREKTDLGGARNTKLLDGSVIKKKKPKKEDPGETPQDRDAGLPADGGGRVDEGIQTNFKKTRATLTRLGVSSVGPIKDKISPGCLDIKTTPDGASVIIGSTIAGKTPLRLGLKTGRSYLIVLNKEGRSVAVRKVKLGKRQGKRLAVKLSAVKKKRRKARTGHTAVRVDCKPPDVHRIYLNGWDSGFNCPVALRVGVGKNDIGYRIPGTRKKMRYKDFYVRTGKLAKIKLRLSK